MQSFQSTLSAQIAGKLGSLTADNVCLVSTSIVLSWVFRLSSKTVSSLSLGDITARHDFVQVESSSIFKILGRIPKVLTHINRKTPNSNHVIGQSLNQSTPVTSSVCPVQRQLCTIYTTENLLTSLGPSWLTVTTLDCFWFQRIAGEFVGVCRSSSGEIMHHSFYEVLRYQLTLNWVWVPSHAVKLSEFDGTQTWFRHVW